MILAALCIVQWDIMTINIQKQNEEDLRKMVATSVFDGYFEEQAWNKLAHEGVDKLALDPLVVAAVINTELVALCIANEKKLLEELNTLLHRFTDSDKKLDKKEREDAMQYVCKSRPGYLKGLNYQVADRYINEFCKANRVKVKVGIFAWEIPK